MRTEEQFKSELQKARLELEKRGRKIDVSQDLDNESGLQCDFDLPYSSMPDLKIEKWAGTKVLEKSAQS